MKNTVLTLLLAVLVVLTSVMLRRSFTGATALANSGNTLLAIGPSPVPIPPHVAAIGPSPVPIPPHVAAIGPSPVPIPPHVR
jgi:hypothetical protein